MCTARTSLAMRSAHDIAAEWAAGLPRARQLDPVAWRHVQCRDAYLTSRYSPSSGILQGGSVQRPLRGLSRRGRPVSMAGLARVLERTDRVGCVVGGVGDLRTDLGTTALRTTRLALRTEWTARRTDRGTNVLLRKPMVQCLVARRVRRPFRLRPG